MHTKPNHNNKNMEREGARGKKKYPTKKKCCFRILYIKHTFYSSTEKRQPVAAHGERVERKRAQRRNNIYFPFHFDKHISNEYIEREKGK